MALEFAAIPLAFAAGAIGILSPCVWPLVPVVMTSAGSAGRAGPPFLALGLASAFALAGTVLTLVLLSLGLDPVAFRTVAAVLLVLVALMLLVPSFGAWASAQLSRLTGGFNSGAGGSGAGGSGAGARFAVGALLGLVWLPCVGPTLGAAIALASLGQQMAMAFAVMFTFGLGTAAALLAAAWLSGRILNRWRPALTATGGRGKQLLGALLLVLGIMVLTGTDKLLETFALGVLPDWAISL